MSNIRIRSVAEPLVASGLAAKAARFLRPADAMGVVDDPVDVLDAALEGTYNDYGVRRWCVRPRTSPDGAGPRDHLGAGWQSDDAQAQRVRALARGGRGAGAYFADTPGGASAELLRHEEIVDAADLAGVVAVLWSLQVSAAESEAPRPEAPSLPLAVLVGHVEAWPPVPGGGWPPACPGRTLAGRAGRRRQAGRGRAGGQATDGVPRRCEPRDARVYVCFGEAQGAVGWRAAEGGVPREVIEVVRHGADADAGPAR